MVAFPGFDTESERQLFKKELEFWGINPGNQKQAKPVDTDLFQKKDLSNVKSMKPQGYGNSNKTPRMHPIDDNIGKKPAQVALPNSLIKMMSTRPVNATDPVIKKWDTLGPMNLNDPKMKNEWSTIDGLHFG